MTTEQQKEIAEQEEYLAKLRSALEDIPAGVTTINAFGMSATFDRNSLMREIRSVEYRIQNLKNKNNPRVFSMVFR